MGNFAFACFGHRLHCGGGQLCGGGRRGCIAQHKHLCQALARQQRDAPCQGGARVQPLAAVLPQVGWQLQLALRAEELSAVTRPVGTVQVGAVVKRHGQKCRALAEPG